MLLSTPTKNPGVFAEGIEELWVCPTWSSYQVAAAPEGVVETSPRGSPCQPQFQWSAPVKAWSAQFVLSDAVSPACFLPSHAFTHTFPGFLPLLHHCIRHSASHMSPDHSHKPCFVGGKVIGWGHLLSAVEHWPGMSCLGQGLMIVLTWWMEALLSRFPPVT